MIQREIQFAVVIKQAFNRIAKRDIVKKSSTIARLVF